MAKRSFRISLEMLRPGHYPTLIIHALSSSRLKGSSIPKACPRSTRKAFWRPSIKDRRMETIGIEIRLCLRVRT